MFMNNTTELTLIIFVILLQILLFYKIISYKTILDNKNVQLIQFHLDTKFICKGLIDSLCISDSATFCNALIKKIKEYYNLEDIIVIDSLSMIDGENNTAIRSEVISFLKNNINKISKNLQDHKLTKVSINNTKMNYVLYLSRLMEKDEGDGLIVCVENTPTLLNKNEKTSLENCINLLKTRLIYE
jgi:hypothetical protein